MIGIVITYVQVRGLYRLDRESEDDSITALLEHRPGAAKDNGLNLFKWGNLDFSIGALNAYLDRQKNDLSYKMSDIEENKHMSM